MKFCFAILRNIISILFLWFYSSIYMGKAIQSNIAIPAGTIILSKGHVYWFLIPSIFTLVYLYLRQTKQLTERNGAILKNIVETISLALILYVIVAWELPFFKL